MNLPEGYFLQEKKYRLTRTIGQGGFGITYLGVWNTEVKGELGTIKTKVPICIKEYFFKDYCYREKNSQAVKVHSLTGEKLFGKFKEKLITEANILSAVHHPNIVNVLEVFEENNTAYIVMEYIKGCSLKHLLDTGGVLPEYKVIKYTHQIGNALNFVHGKNIVHLDIKPGNILIDQDDNARLIDFGVSKRYDIEEQETSTTTLTLSKGFAAIEQYDDEGMTNFSSAPDIYSLGATMYNLLTGVIPIESILRVTKQMLPPSSYNVSISSKTEKAILKAMEIKPENRFRTVNELLAVIETPVYEFTGNESVETNLTDNEDQTDVIEGHTPHVSTDDDDQTVIKSPSANTGRLEKPAKRRTTLRRVTLVASILLIAVIGYAVFNLFFDGIKDPDGIKLPGDSTKISLVNHTDNIESETPETPETPDLKTDTTEQSVRNSPVLQPNNNPPSQTLSVNTATSNLNAGNTNTRESDGKEVTATTLTQAEIAKLEREYDDIKQDGLSKMSTEGYQGALIDFNKCLAIAEKTDRNLSEINKLITDCNEKIKEREIEAELAKYTTIGPFGDFLKIATRNDNGMYGAINSSGIDVIPCVYIDISRIPNSDNRAFKKENGRFDVYNNNGRLEQSNVHVSE